MSVKRYVKVFIVVISIFLIAFLSFCYFAANGSIGKINYDISDDEDFQSYIREHDKKYLMEKLYTENADIFHLAADSFKSMYSDYAKTILDSSIGADMNGICYRKNGTVTFEFYEKSEPLTLDFSDEQLKAFDIVFREFEFSRIKFSLSADGTYSLCFIKRTESKSNNDNYYDYGISYSSVETNQIKHEYCFTEKDFTDGIWYYYFFGYGI